MLIPLIPLRPRFSSSRPLRRSIDAGSLLSSTTRTLFVTRSRSGMYAGSERRDGKHEPRAAAEVVANAGQQRARKTSDAADEAIEPRRAEAVRGDAEVTERAPDRDAASFPNRNRRSEQRNEQAGCDGEQIDPRRNGETADVEIEKHRHRSAERAAAGDPHGNRDRERCCAEEQRLA